MKQASINIRVDDVITSNGKYPNLEKYFRDGPKRVTRVTTGSSDAGGYFVFIKHNNQAGELGFYINGVKRVY